MNKLSLILFYIVMFANIYCSTDKECVLINDEEQQLNSRRVLSTTQENNCDSYRAESFSYKCIFDEQL